MLPTEVLEKSAAALLDFQGKGFGIAEVSHRGKEFEGVNDEAMTRCKQLLGWVIRTTSSSCRAGRRRSSPSSDELPAQQRRLSRQRRVEQEGPGLRQGSRQAERRRQHEASNFDHSPGRGRMEDDRRGRLLSRLLERDRSTATGLATWPKHPNLIVDASSEFLSRRHPANECAWSTAAHKKNLGPAGVVLVIVRKDMYARQKKVPTKLWSFKDQAETRAYQHPTFRPDPEAPQLGRHLLLPGVHVLADDHQHHTGRTRFFWCAAVDHGALVGWMRAERNSLLASTISSGAGPSCQRWPWTVLVRADVE